MVHDQIEHYIVLIEMMKMMKIAMVYEKEGLCFFNDYCSYFYFFFFIFFFRIMNEFYI